MKQENKQLLFKDLCAILPYHDLYVQYNNKCWLAVGYGHGRIELIPNLVSSIAGPYPLIKDVKPYLRPMSSMTEEEREEYDNWHLELESGRIKDWKIANYIDWLNAHHLDYRGLIEKGLAFKAPEGMY